MADATRRCLHTCAPVLARTSGSIAADARFGGDMASAEASAVLARVVLTASYVAVGYALRRFGALERAGLEVDVFVATYRCTNGADLVGRHLKRWYARWLRGLTIADRAARGASLSLALV